MQETVITTSHKHHIPYLFFYEIESKSD